jgi:Domain of unknown function (DUF4276)
MIDVILIVEGQAEQSFLNAIVRPALLDRGIVLAARLISTSNGNRGGGVNYARLEPQLQALLLERQDRYVGTFIDLYALNEKFPGVVAAKTLNGGAIKAQCIESAFFTEFASKTTSRPERLLPHVQPYELEALYFSDVDLLCKTEATWPQASGALKAVKDAYPTPEDINGHFDTKPSNRLQTVLKPKYYKTRHSPLIAKQLGLRTILEQCPHFALWFNKLLTLNSL